MKRTMLALASIAVIAVLIIPAFAQDPIPPKETLEAMVPGPKEYPIVAAVVILLLGLANTFRIRFPLSALTALAIVIGFVRGVVNGAGARAAEGQWLSVLGLVVGVCVVGVMLAGFSRWLGKRGAVVVFRVAGSWIAAIGLLMLGWEIRR